MAIDDLLTRDRATSLESWQPPTGLPYDARTMQHPQETIPSGDIFPLGGQAGFTTGLLVQGREYATPFYLPSATTISKLALEVTTAGTTGALARIGIRAHNTANGWPGSLLLDAGTIDGTVVTTPVITLGSSLALAAGWYWQTVSGQGSPTTQATVRCNAANSVQFPAPFHLPNSAGFATLSIVNLIAYYQTAVTGALGASFTPVAGAGTSARVMAQVA